MSIVIFYYLLKFSIVAPIFIILLSKLLENIFKEKLSSIIFLQNNIYSILLITFYLILLLILFIFILYIKRNKSKSGNITIDKVSNVGNEFFFDLYTFILLSYEFFDKNIGEILNKYVIWILFIILLFICLSNTSNNYILKILGYNYYIISTTSEDEYILITKRKKFFCNENNKIKVIHLYSNICLEII
ncbi:hypothetical protein SU43_03570 [Brachyspira hyodysenteriae]|nr:hypothetical protein SU43_03570 [Brachyspira hyodysenteriae]TVL82378.1 hypothetical protein A9X82_12710 [Brachyspira hyodysenteriae]